MEVLTVLVFTSLVLVTGAVILFIIRIRGGDFEHAERLSLLPLEQDDDGGPRPGRSDLPSDETAADVEGADG